MPGGRRRVATRGSAAAAVLCIAAIGCAGGAADSSPLPASVPPDFFGVVPQGLLTEDDLDRMGQGGVGTLRLVFSWQALDPTAKPGDADLSTIDPYVLGAARNGIRVLPTLYGTPAWVAEGLDGEQCGDACATYAPRSPEALAAWETFVGEMVDRYGPGGELWSANPDIDPIPVAVWQIWNEQNSPSFFTPAPDPATYERIVSAASDTIRERDPAAEVILGGMFGEPLKGKPPAYTAWDFLHRIYAIDGARDDFDGIAAHPYSANLDSLESQVELLHDEVEKADDDASLWITEVGASSADTGVYLELGPDGQAELLRGAFEFFVDRRDEWKIQNVTWYSWRDTADENAPCAWCAQSGLFPADGFDPKPSWDAFVSFTGGS